MVEKNMALQQIIISQSISIITKIIDVTSSESEDDELEYVMRMMKNKTKWPKLKNYVENIVPAYSDQQFKSHFR